eukprot:SAG31_NODE_41068_length_277_cov_715.101124_1_plen_55_part_01
MGKVAATDLSWQAKAGYGLEVRRHRVDKTGTILVPVPVSIVELLKSQLTFGPEIV